MKQFNKKTKIKTALFLVTALAFYWILPKPLFNDPYATVLLDSEGELLSASIAEDQQWRFPAMDSVPNKLEQCILHFEDEYFHYHPGINPVSLGRAVWQNLTENRVVSGGSTITMQVVRLSRKNPKRTYLQKISEMIMAIRLEFSYSKNEILAMYASHAPYGGNVVGAETASWRYFQRPLNQLSWSENAMLAVLPNSPALIHLGKNRTKLKNKRNRLLKKLYSKAVIDSMTYSLALMEEIPNKPNPLPNESFHALQLAKQNGFTGKRVKTKLNKRLQATVNQKVDYYVSLLAQNQVYNACAIVVSVKTGEVLAYSGNSRNSYTRSKFVDLIQSPRSSGSILKPLLYAQAQQEGFIHSTSLLRDVPVVLDRFSPGNYNGRFEGVVRANDALARSLNVPATLLLKDYGYSIFYNDLQRLGFTTINRSADNYGLTLILGGAEVTLWELAQVYSAQANQLNYPNKSKVPALKVWANNDSIASRKLIDNGAWYLTTEALTQVQRPGINKDWRKFASSKKIAWKTGTSHGFRDAWAIGYNPDYLVGVWVGNADGEGRPGLTGVSAAGPILFDLFEGLPQTGGINWFEEPAEHLHEIELCAESGYNPTPQCPKIWVDQSNGAELKKRCQYHKSILINQHNERVFRNCYSGPTRDTTLFELDAIASYFYHKKHIVKKKHWPVAASCKSKQNTKNLAIIYPTANSSIIIPTNLRGEQEKVLLKAAHKSPQAKLYWHLNDKFIGVTELEHEMPVGLKPGKYKLTLMDDGGNSVSCEFRGY